MNGKEIGQMGTKVNIMDMEVDLLPKETFQAEIQKYLDNDYLDVVHMISLDYIDNYLSLIHI